MNNHKKYLGVKELADEIKKTDFSVNSILKINGYRNIPLSFEQAYLLGAFALAPYVKELQDLVDFPKELLLTQSVAALCTLHNRALYQNKASAEQIAGICAAVFDYDIGTSEHGFLNPQVSEVMDNCGMGGDLYRTPNLSTIAALIAAAGGINMLKHGSPGNTDNTGSSDFLAHCNVNLFPSKKVVERAVQELHFGYTDALDEGYKRIHTQTHQFAMLAHMNDIIGPITNPIHPKYMKKRVIGINHLIPPERVADAYRILNERGITYVEHGLFIRGFVDQEKNGGIDEVSIMPGGTIVAELVEGEIKTYTLFARDFGLEKICAKELDPGENKAETSRQILSGEITDGKTETALANAAILFYLAQKLSLPEGTEKAREVLKSKRPLQILEQYAKQSYGGKEQWKL